MKKFWMRVVLLAVFCIFSCGTASAVSNDTLKVGLRYGSGALFSANLENAVGSGYFLGYYDSDRVFTELGYTSRTAVSVTAAGVIYLDSAGSYTAENTSDGTVMGAYRIQLDDVCGDFYEAADLASAYPGGYPAYVSDEYRVRIGCYGAQEDAEKALGKLGVSGTVVSAGKTGVVVTATRTAEILFEFDCQGACSLAIFPDGQGGDAETWFKGYRYNGGFQYDRITGGNLNVVNVVNLEDYVNGVIPYEMSPSWPLAALQAQSICARTYACQASKHQSSYGFDVCNTTDCQVYCGVGTASAVSREAVASTAGQLLYYDGRLIEAVYFSSDGGATENCENVWEETLGYLRGKPDPYESAASIPNYAYTVTYTPSQLTWVLQNSGYSIGTIENVYVSEFTALGNVGKVTFVDTAGKTMTLKGDKARTAFYSTTYGKIVKSMRFTISGGNAAAYYVNSASNPRQSLKDVSVISGGGTITTHTGDSISVLTSSGTAQLTGGATASGDLFTITGTGNGHNVGLSQYGAKAMAEQGHSYLDILNFYYTDVTIG